MIVLHKLNDKEFVVNAEMIKFLESTPDTVITLAQTNEKFMVKENIDEVIRKVIEYKQKCCEVIESKEC